MNTTKRYFALCGELIDALNRAALPPVMLKTALDEVTQQVQAAIARQAQEKEPEEQEEAHGDL